MESAIFNNEHDVQYLLRKQVTLIENFDSQKIYSDINEVVELFKVKKAFELDVFVPEWMMKNITPFPILLNNFQNQLVFSLQN